jgi:hypothetical protein
LTQATGNPMNAAWPEAQQKENSRSRAAIRLMAIISVCHLMLPIVQLVLFLTHPATTDAQHNQALMTAATISILFALSGLTIFLASYFFYFLWIYQAHKNLSLIELENLQYPPDWAVGWYFIPFCNFLKPFHVMRELWRASDPERYAQGPTAWQSAPVSNQVNLWWMLWLVSWLVDQLTANVELSHQGFAGALTLLLISAVLSAASCFATMRLIQAIHARQARIWQSLLPAETAKVPAWLTIQHTVPTESPEPVDTDDPL